MAQILAVLTALGITAVLIQITGGNSLSAYQALLYGSFGNPRRICEIIIRAIPLILGSLGIIIAFKASIWNIGGPGQMCMGAVLGVATALNINMPGFLHLPLVLCAGFLGGGLWAMIPGILRAKFDINEVVTTVLMNYISLFFMTYLVSGPWKEPGSWVAWTDAIPTSARLPVLIYRLHAGLFIALLCIPSVIFLLSRTVLGYRIRAVGSNPEASSYGGISVTKYILIAIFLSGGLFGLAGVNELCGIHYRLFRELLTAPGAGAEYGYTAIPVALLGRLNPLGALLAALFFGMIISGSDVMRGTAGVSLVITDVLQGLVMLFVLISEILARKKGGQ